MIGATTLKVTRHRITPTRVATRVKEYNYRRFCISEKEGEAPIITNPYRPLVGKTTPYDPPFVVKSNNELPATQRESNCITCRKPMNTNRNRPFMACQNVTIDAVKMISLGFPGSRKWRLNGRTISLDGYSGTVEVVHSRKKAIE